MTAMEAAATFRGDTRVQDRGEVRVWALPAPMVASPTTLNLTALDERERQRMNAFVRDRDRVLYGFAHAALRTILSALTGEAPAALRFARAPCPCCDEPHGRPVLTPARLEFSLSHSRDLVLIGVAPTPIGVDTEPVPKLGTAEQLARVLHPAEREEMAAALPEHRAAIFARLWVRKEAYLKGLGTGLGRSLAADDVRGGVAGWHLSDLSVGPGQAAAVAVDSPAPCEIRLHRALPMT
ncbi:4'-phosphopantetheinyl transferase family protein [Streptomyces europaeiscabiei]|uniref:4'-phosphopantetheinyl transferase family protein n=1 Tax=Streptomyces europaeiscabiei TaxID=146819 RepID=UPI002E2DA6BB|nr:4'-phosphopantetheinyl transferase superfamily protein [Streptomyces europaeiscabiei]